MRAAVVGPARGSNLLRATQRGLFLAGEAGWLFGWALALGSWLGPAAGPLLGPVAVVALLVAATLLTRLVLRAPGPGLPLRLARLGLAGLGLLVALLVGMAPLWAGRPPNQWSAVAAVWLGSILGIRTLAATGLALLTWGRGIAAGRSRLTLDEVEGEFRWAVLALAALFFLTVLAGTDPAATTGPFVASALVALFAGLLGMPLARTHDVGASERHREGGGLRMNRQWLGMLLGTVGALLVLGVLLAAVLTFERIDWLLGPVVGLADVVLGAVVYAIALPFGYLIEGLIYLIRLLLHPGSRPQPPQRINLQRPNPFKGAQPGAGPPALLALVVKWTLVVLVAGLVLALLARAVTRPSESATDDEVEEERDFVWSWAAVRATLARWWQSLWGRRRALIAPGRPRPVPVAPTDPSTWGPREIYRELLRLGTRAGRRRAAAETPHEYARALADQPPLSADVPDLAAVTAVYEQDRYGDSPPTPPTVADARQALDRLRRLEEGSETGEHHRDAEIAENRVRTNGSGETGIHHRGAEDTETGGGDAGR